MPDAIQEIEMPLGAEMLTVALQHGDPVLWAKVDLTVGKKEPRKIYTFGTGQTLPLTIDDLRYVGTYQLGENVMHVFVQPRVRRIM